MKVSNIYEDNLFNSNITIISPKEKIQRNIDYMYDMGRQFCYRKAMDFVQLEELAEKFELDTEDDQYYCYCLTSLNSLMNKIFMSIDCGINGYRHTFDQEIVKKLSIDYKDWCKRFDIVERDINSFGKKLAEKHGKSMK